MRIALITSLIFMMVGCYAKPDLVQVGRVTPNENIQGVKARRWILVDTRLRALTVMDGEKPAVTFADVSFGSGGVGCKLVRGDNLTPIGRFRIGWINPSSKFKYFLGINYPSEEYAERGLQRKVIDGKTFERICGALKDGRVPPQNTKLGGYIGIHGIGRGSLTIHHLLDWTDGCIALDNKQIQELAQMVTVGMEVVIQ